ncbi:hypothetical protein [Pseudomonas cremoricolorata]|uniref:hypothetical protein n=1 Tax=Pseudomonas cremoricolorata TaxID=157783 RepID=UPI000405B338|nr:hypothetical protein [Pseudomonas cremoricolorata]
MSLESDVANLVTQNTKLIDFFGSKKAGIEAAVAAAIAAIPETVRTWYVDQVNGLDTNPGTKEAPFKTVNKAINATPNYGMCTIELLSDYVMTDRVSMKCSTLVLSGGTSGFKVIPKYYPIMSGDVATSTAMGGFNLVTYSNSVELRNTTLELPSSAGVSPTPPSMSLNTGFLRTNSTGGVPPVIGLALSAAKVTAPSDFIGALIGNTVASVSLITISTSFPSGFGGKYIMGIASGTAPKDTNNVLSNLASL